MMFYIGLIILLLVFGYVFYPTAANGRFLEVVCEFLEAITLTLLTLIGFSLVLSG
jgi:hypothetical protein